jgi:DEAD/DEAH box helicase domain-containing protein
VASSSPLDQYIISHPTYFFGQSPEHAHFNPDNLHVLLSHVKCATFELPFTTAENYGVEDLQKVLGFLEEGRLVRQSRGAWYWSGDGYPAAEVSLRTADPHQVNIVDQDDEGERHTIGQLDRPSASRLVHEGAIYWHEGQQYHVEALDWDAGIARVRAVSVDYYTEASSSTRIDIQSTLHEVQHSHATLARGEVLLTSHVSGYRRWRMGSLEHLGWGEVNLPEQQMLTSACWLTIPEALVERLREEGWWVGERVESRGPSWSQQRDLARRRDRYCCRWCGAPERPGHQHDVHHIVPFRDFKWVPGQNENHLEANQLANLVTLCTSCHHRAEQHVAVQSTLSSLGRVLGNIIPLLLMCDPGDVGLVSDVQAPQTGLPTLFVFDTVPGGVGLSEGVMNRYAELLFKSVEMVRDCPCPSGCPSCIGPVNDSDGKAKQQVLRFIQALQ